MGPKKIMVVDDNQVFLEELKETLTVAKYKTMAIHDSTKAVDAALAYQPDLILLDFMMEGMHGFKVAERLRESPLTRHIPLIAMSAFLSEDHEGMLKEMYGFRTFLAKPFGAKRMLAEIKNILNETNQGSNASGVT
ncbi:MAG: response regulator [bacterium]